MTIAKKVEVRDFWYSLQDLVGGVLPESKRVELEKLIGQVEEEAKKEGIRMFHKEVTNNTLISELSGWPSILDYSKDRLLENLNLNTK